MNERQELDRLLPEQFRPHSVPISAFRMSKKGEELIIKPHSECVHLVYKRLSNYFKLSTLCVPEHFVHYVREMTFASRIQE